jgi:hypothetical protein
MARDIRRVETLAALRAEIEIGIRELDAGLGKELDIEDLIRKAREEHENETANRGP